MAKKSESYFKNYLKNITNEQLVQFYDDVEWTPFPVLVIKEYQNRFKAKNKKEVIQKLKSHAEIAKEKTQELRSLAKTRSAKVTKEIKTKGKKLTKSIGESALISSEKNLRILEKLGELNKKGIITNQEFNEKKKQLLKRI
jgi:hydroxymethylpyrimidine/phosphomethylpyrimidine kinase